MAETFAKGKSKATNSEQQAPAISTRANVKQMSKAERRALQESQRQAKQDSSATASATTRKSASTTAVPVSVASKASHTSTNDSNHNQTYTASNMFNHLTLSSSSSSASSAKQQKLEKEVHPAITSLALQWSAFQIVGANARCISMLQAFQQVIRSYTVPAGTSLARHLPSVLSPQIEHLYKFRSRSLTLGNAIRYLKWEIAQVPLEMDEDEAKEWLVERIDHFIRDRIVVADKVIEAHTLGKIRDGDVVMTYARSSVVESSLIEAKNQGKNFSVIVVDSRPMLEGKNLCLSLATHNIPTTYILLSALGPILSRVSLVLLGTHALLSDGAMFSRAGTATVAMMAKAAGIPVVCCCETYKFTERIMLDSIGGNERGASTDLLPSAPPSLFSMSSAPKSTATLNPNLSIFNLLYDVSRPDDVTCVISEAGLIPVRSVTAVMREFKPLGNAV